VVRPVMEVLRGKLCSANGGLSQSDPTLPSGWAAPSSTSTLTEGERSSRPQLVKWTPSVVWLARRAGCFLAQLSGPCLVSW
jgi:hypothetical protein